MAEANPAPASDPRRLGRIVHLAGAVAMVLCASAAGAANSALTDDPRPPESGAGPSHALVVPTQQPPKAISIGWVGDVTPGSSYGVPPSGGRALFAAMRSQLQAPDLMIANLEGTYSEPGPSKCDGSDNPDCFVFQAPRSIAPALAWSGIDLVNLANNHAYDYGETGRQQTVAALNGIGVAYTGLPDQIRIVTVDGVRVAAVGLSYNSWAPGVRDLPIAQALVRRATQSADIVVVLFHGGAEGSDEIHTPIGHESDFGEPRGDTRAFAHAVVDAGADLVLGSGPHVVRGIERYQGRLIAYSLGNFGGWGNFQIGGNLSLSGLLTIEIGERGVLRRGRWHSLSLVEPGVPVVDPSGTSAGLVDELSRADFDKVWRMHGPRGESISPPRRGPGIGNGSGERVS